MRLFGSIDCTPGYYNNEGQPGDGLEWFLGYPTGAVSYFRYLNEWRSSGAFEGLEFR
jgi:cyclohexanone monooxygenase